MLQAVQRALTPVRSVSKSTARAARRASTPVRRAYTQAASWWSELSAEATNSSECQNNVNTDGFASFFYEDDAPENSNEASDELAEANNEAVEVFDLSSSHLDSSTTTVDFYDFTTTVEEEGSRTPRRSKMQVAAETVAAGAVGVAGTAAGYAGAAACTAAGAGAEAASKAAAAAGRGLDALKRFMASSPSIDCVEKSPTMSDDGWNIFPGCSIDPSKSFGQDGSTISCVDVEECKRVCIARGCTGFVFTSGDCNFYTCSREDLLGPAQRCMLHVPNSRGFTAVPTLFVAPSDDEAKLQHEWIQSMEANLLSLRRLAEQHRLSLAEAKKQGDDAKVEAIDCELYELKSKIARLAEALWLAMSAERVTLNGERTASFDSDPDFLEQMTMSAERITANCARTGSFESESDFVESMMNQASSVEKLSFTAKDGDDKSHSDSKVSSRVDLETSGHSTSSVLNSINEHSGPDELAAQGKNGLHSFPQGDDMPSSSGISKSSKGFEIFQKGKGKGGPLPPKKGAGKGHRNQSPIGRNFHWKGLRPDQVRGTIFDDEVDGARRDSGLNLEALQMLFQAEDVGGAEASLKRRSSGSSKSEVRVFTTARAQHVAIVLRRVFGPTLKVENAQWLATNLEALKLAQDGVDGSGQLGAEELELLASIVPSAEEVASLRNAPIDQLRHIERSVLPLAFVPRAEARLRVLRLEAQAKALHELPSSCIQSLCKASHALRESMTLRHLLRVVAQLGSWINSADLQAQPGFALSSALGKLHQFRAFRGDKKLSLLHIVVLSAAGGDQKEVSAFRSRLNEELKAVSGAARLDLRELGNSVSACRAEADWLATELKRAENAPDEYTEQARSQLKRIYEMVFLVLTTQLEKAWAETRKELEATLVFFAERVQPDKGIEPAVEHLLQTVEEFRVGLWRAAQEIQEQPARFAKVYAAMPTKSKPSSVELSTERMDSSSTLPQPLKATPSSGYSADVNPASVEVANSAEALKERDSFMNQLISGSSKGNGKVTDSAAVKQSPGLVEDGEKLPKAADLVRPEQGRGLAPSPFLTAHSQSLVRNGQQGSRPSADLLLPGASSRGLATKSSQKAPLQVSGVQPASGMSLSFADRVAEMSHSNANRIGQPAHAVQGIGQSAHVLQGRSQAVRPASRGDRR